MVPTREVAMAPAKQEYDAVIVGGSLAGCTAAIALGKAGAHVALVEQRPEPEAFKRICSHFIQSSAVPTLERLGLLDEIEQAGGVRSRLRMWTRWGWTEFDSTQLPAAVNLRRERLDPLMRRIAAETPGVELKLGMGVDRLVSDSGRVCGVEAVERSGDRHVLRGQLVVGADGRDSRVAELAELRKRTWPHGRIAYGGYFEGPPPDGAPDGRMWLLDPQWAAAFPTDSGLTFYACMPTKDHLPEFKSDTEAAMRKMIGGLPDAPPIDQSRLVSPVLGKIDMTNVMRSPVAPGLALACDAALATDPLWGVGCGWAIQSAEWLADAVTPALLGSDSLERGLQRYRRTFRRRLGGHARMIHDYAGGRKLNPGERLLFSAAPRDARLAALTEAFGTRNITPGKFLLRGIPRALAVHAGLAGRGRRRSADAIVEPA